MRTFHASQSFRVPMRKFIHATHDQYNLDHTIVRGRVGLSGRFGMAVQNNLTPLIFQSN